MNFFLISLLFFYLSFSWFIDRNRKILRGFKAGFLFKDKVAKAWRRSSGSGSQGLSWVSWTGAQGPGPGRGVLLRTSGYCSTTHLELSPWWKCPVRPAKFETAYLLYLRAKRKYNDQDELSIYYPINHHSSRFCRLPLLWPWLKPLTSLSLLLQL